MICSPGDKVQLIGGHYCMTVVRELPYGEYQCAWMSSNGQLWMTGFLPSTLEPYVPNSSYTGSVPIGCMMSWPGALSLVPAGWQICDGRSLAIIEYSSLFAVLGTTYGGDGVTTFNLPNRCGKFGLGSGVGVNPGETGGSVSHIHADHIFTPSGTNSVPSFTGSVVTTSSVSAGTPSGLLSGGSVSDHSGTQVTISDHTYTPQGTVAAPTFTGSSVNTSLVSAGTPSGICDYPIATPTISVGAHTHGTGSLTTSWPAGVPTFTGTAMATHAHELPFIKASGGTGQLKMLAQTVFGSGTSRAPESISAAPTANTTAAAVALSQAVSAGTPAGTIAWPAGIVIISGSTASATPTATSSWPGQNIGFTGSPMGTHQHAVTAAGTNSAPAFTGTQATITHSVNVTQPSNHTFTQPIFAGDLLPTHSHSVTATGSVSAPSFSGNQATLTHASTSHMPPYITEAWIIKAT